MSDPELLLRRVEREKKARAAAESILESKSLELHEATVAAQDVAKQLREQNTKFQAILDYAAEGIITVDADGLVTSFNPAAVRIFGYQPDSIIGKCLSTLVADFSCDLFSQLRETEDGIQEARECKGRKADGSEFILEITVSCIDDDELQMMIAFVRDRTKRKHLETQLAFAQKMESVGQLAAGIAHEINTPIQYVGDNAKFLQDAFANIDALLDLYESLSRAVESNSDVSSELIEKIRSQTELADLEFVREEVPQAIDQTISGADRVASIVRAMKEFSHPGTSKKTAFDVNEALQSTVTVSSNEWKYVANVELDLEESLPNGLGFPGDLNQAFLNIIVNAAHAIEKRQKTEKNHEGIIQISTRSMNDWIEIRLSDNGTGIKSEDMKRIFDPFFTTKPVGKGTGQGLSITHSVVVEKHGGKLDVSSEPGLGTTFTLRIPKADGVPVETGALESEES